MRDRVTIQQGRLWQFPSLIPYVIINTIDILSLITNPKTYVAFHGKSIVSFCCIKRWGKIIEIGDAYTMRKFRRHGHFRELMRAVMKKYRRVYILTHSKLVEVAQRYGFKIVASPPMHFRLRQILAYAVLGLFYRPWIVLRRDA
jgi:GNAT superfamily N-acetyltransferase